VIGQCGAGHHAAAEPGACATAGGIQALRNWADCEEFMRAVYASPEYITTLATSPMPNQMINNGSSASLGIGRLISIGGGADEVMLRVIAMLEGWERVG